MVSTQSNKLPVLERIPLFAKLPTIIRRELEAAGGLQRIGQGTELFREGTRADFVYAIIEGMIALVSGGPGEESVIDFFGPGEVILVPPVLLDLPYMVSAKATSDVEALLIPAEKFRQLINSNAALAAACAKLLSSHWRLLLRQLKQLKTPSADARLVRFLLEGVSESTGNAVLHLPSSKRELASHLGITPATLSRSLARLRELGVDTRGETIEIKSIERLREALRPASPPFALGARG
ncbi:MAG: cyclic nucleotide-binding domain-containing protein [Alphaproteobacteria bacterium]